MMARLKKMFARPPLGMMIYLLFVLANFLLFTYLLLHLITSPLCDSPPSQPHFFADQPTA